MNKLSIANFVPLVRTTNSCLLPPPPSKAEKTLGNHVCCLFSDESVLQQAIALYIARAFQVNGRVACVTLDDDLCRDLCDTFPDFRPIGRDAIIQLLRGAGVAVEDEVAKNRLVLLNTRGTYLRDGPFNPDAVADTFRDAYKESLEMGFNGLFGIGDMTWAALARADDAKRVHEYECKITDLHAECPKLLGFCFYDKHVLPPGFLRKVLTTHPQAVMNGEFFKSNFYYIPPTEFLGSNPKKAVLDHWVQNLKDRRMLDETVASKTVALHLNNVQLQQELANNAQLHHEKKLAELASQHKSAFVAMLSHEIRTPLHGILTTCSLLESSSQQGEESAELIHIAKTSSTQLQVIVEEVLQYSALENGQISTEHCSFTVSDVLESALKIITATDGARGKHFASTISPLVPASVEGDKQKLSQVLLNLLSNTAKFTPIDGRIDVTVAWHTVGHLDVTVSNSGIGIAPERISQLGQAFTQLDQSNTRRYGGIGLGLAISRHYLETVGGALTITSEGENRGTQAAFTFPVAACHPVQKPVTAAAAPPATLDTSIKILLVEDNPVNIKVTQRLLARLGFTAKVATEGLAAVEEIRQNESYDLILMDLHMPGSLDGLEATRVIRSLFTGRSRQPKIYALTASIGDEVKHRCYEAGMDGFLSKPLNTALFKQALQDTKRGH